MEKYEVIGEIGSLVKIRCKNLTYTVDVLSKSLIKLESSSSHWVNAKIPHKFPTGHVIDNLGRRFLCGNGKFNKIIVEKDIQVESNAFEEAKAHKVVWSEGCKIIPKECFKSSWIEEIFNIQSVEEIRDSAFEFSCIKKMAWPSKCETIPKDCFYGSCIKSIVNLDSVKAIDKNAFYGSSVECLDFSGTEDLRLAPSSLAGIYTDCEIIPSYYMDSNLLEDARRDKIL